MAEYENKLKVTLEGTVEEHGEIHETYEGLGVIMLVDNGKGIGSTIAGGWGAVTVATALNALRKMVGDDMFKEASEIWLGNLMYEAIGRDSTCADEESENKKKAAAAAREVQNGEETDAAGED